METSVGVKENITSGDYDNETLTVKSSRLINPMTAAKNEQTNSSYKVFNQHPAKDNSVQINPQQKEVPIMQAPEGNKITYKYLYKYRCRAEHLDSVPPCQRLAKLDHPVQQTQFENFNSTLNYWRMLQDIM